MEVFEIIVALLAGGAILAAVARRLGAPYPALVALAGAALALLPGVPTVVLDPELALTLFVAPVLVDAAFDASPRDLIRNWRHVTGLVIGAVVVTTAIVAVVAHALVPDLPWAAAIALGAIVAPPDAAAATTVLRQLRPPHRLLVILEGESLFNDASALLIYRMAVGATLTGFVSGWSVVPMVLGATVGSVLLGLLLARLTVAISGRIRDVATAVVFQFTWTFGVWILAERLHLSGIITMVVFAMSAARRAPEAMPARIRVPSWAFWEVAVFVLNVLAFILVGFQLRSIAERVSGPTGMHYALVAAVVCAAVIVARLVWVAGAAALARRRNRRLGRPGPMAREAAIVGWCGMRGTVTLAAALALPVAADGGTAFPYRDLIVVVAFGVVLGTLVVQGLTLRPLLQRLGLDDDGAVEREVRLARVDALRAAVAELREAGTDSHVRRSFELQLRQAEEALARLGAGPVTDVPEVAEVRASFSTVLAADRVRLRTASVAQRRRLTALRADGTIGDTAFLRIEEELDWMELGWAHVLPEGDRDAGA